MPDTPPPPLSDTPALSPLSEERIAELARLHAGAMAPYPAGKGIEAVDQWRRDANVAGDLLEDAIERDLPSLLAEVTRLRAENTELRRLLDNALADDAPPAFDVGLLGQVPDAQMLAVKGNQEFTPPAALAGSATPGEE